MPKLVKVENLESNMILADPLVNRYGQVLLSSGTRIENKHMILLKTWGIKYLSILTGDEDEGEPEVDEKVLKQAEERLAKRMQWEPRNDYEKNLYELALRQVYKTIISDANKTKEWI